MCHPTSAPDKGHVATPVAPHSMEDCKKMAHPAGQDFVLSYQQYDLRKCDSYLSQADLD